MKEEKEVIKMKDSPWLCENCKAMLGVIAEDGSELRMKYKDFYVSVRDGEVTTLCRRCGRVNVLKPVGNVEIDLEK